MSPRLQRALLRAEGPAPDLAPKVRKWALAPLVLVALLVLGLLLWPDGTRIRRILIDIWLWLTPTIELRETIRPEHVEQGLNALVFLPVFFLLVLVLPRLRPWVHLLLPVATAWGIEFSQLVLLPHSRLFDPVDALSNSFGGILGVLLGLLFWRVARALSRRIRRRAPR